MFILNYTLHKIDRVGFIVLAKHGQNGICSDNEPLQDYLIKAEGYHYLEHSSMRNLYSVAHHPSCQWACVTDIICN
jgi:hypothetical protein